MINRPITKLRWPSDMEPYRTTVEEYLFDIGSFTINWNRSGRIQGTIVANNRALLEMILAKEMFDILWNDYEILGCKSNTVDVFGVFDTIQATFDAMKSFYKGGEIDNYRF